MGLEKVDNVVTGEYFKTEKLFLFYFLSGGLYIFFVVNYIFIFFM